MMKLDLPPPHGAAAHCPVCGKPTAPRHRPFCSRRCAHIDLGRWLNGSYRIATEDGPDDNSDDSTGGVP